MFGSTAALKPTPQSLVAGSGKRRQSDLLQQRRQLPSRGSNIEPLTWVWIKLGVLTKPLATARAWLVASKKSN
ncbi:hypothetical protein [Xanthomonas sp. MUS 060]|uniref:hypothetical protein n=1 Tax=Xanthomonas sp. MUS 060 TaxID=1588031 RepID=UPI0005F2DB4B|nr:hypothetical protein [Xanthomonas sp. MUS 060]